MRASALQPKSSARPCVHRLRASGVIARAQPQRKRKQKGQAYYDKYKANRARHEGLLLPPLQPGPFIPHVTVQSLQQYLQQELWAYTFGDPPPSKILDSEYGDVTDGASAAAGSGVQGASTAEGTAVKTGTGVVIPKPVESLDAGGDVTALPGRYNTATAKVYVFWDVASKHPWDADPRVIAARIRSVASQYGNPCGLYAYAVRKDWNWVPQYMLQYKDNTMEEEVGLRKGGFTCQFCGVSRKTQAQLDAHVKSVHKERLALLTANSSQQNIQKQKSSSKDDDSDDDPEIRGAGRTQSRKTATTADAAPSSARPSMRNTSRRTLGKVALYHTATGKALVPPVGHQLSLKYCITQEGWEARIVQNSAEAEGVAVASGMGRMLDKIRRGQMDVGPGEQIIVILISEDDQRLTQPLLRLRGVGGCGTIVVKSSGQALQNRAGRGGSGSSGDAGRGKQPSFRGADVVLDWEEIIAY